MLFNSPIEVEQARSVSGRSPDLRFNEIGQPSRVLHPVASSGVPISQRSQLRGSGGIAPPSRTPDKLNDILWQLLRSTGQIAPSRSVIALSRRCPQTANSPPRDDGPSDRQPSPTAQAEDNQYVPQWPVTIEPRQIEIVEPLVKPPV
jgi:hypothetical protein